MAETMRNAANYLSEQIDRDSDWIAFEKECVDAIGSDVFGSRKFSPGDGVPDWIKTIHKFYAERIRVLSEQLRAVHESHEQTKKDLATYKRISSIRKGKS